MRFLRPFILPALLAMVCVEAVAVEPDDPRVTPVVLAYRKARPAVVNISTYANEAA